MRYTLEVESFDSGFMDTQANKAVALKPLEEAAEAFGAWQRYNGDEWDETDGDLERMLLDEIADELADTVQACVNFADREGLDLSAALSRVHDRNAKRGRYGARQMCARAATEVRNDCEEAANLCNDGDGCPANKPGDCAEFKALDIIRRAKALAGAEVAE